MTFLLTNSCSLKLFIPFPLLLRTNNMHVTVSSCTNHISRYICRQRSKFPRNGSLLLIGLFKERNAELEWAAISGEEHCVTTLITAAKETNTTAAATKRSPWTFNCFVIIPCLSQCEEWAKCSFILLEWTVFMYVKAQKERFLQWARVVVITSKFTSSFGRLRQKTTPTSVPHGQHDY